MLTFRRIIIIVLGTFFNVPAVFLIVNAIISSNLKTDDMWAMLFMGTLLFIIGGILWWVAYDMKRKQRKKDTDATAMGLAQLHYLSDQMDNDTDSWTD